MFSIIAAHYVVRVLLWLSNYVDIFQKVAYQNVHHSSEWLSQMFHNRYRISSPLIIPAINVRRCMCIRNTDFRNCKRENTIPLRLGTYNAMYYLEHHLPLNTYIFFRTVGINAKILTRKLTSTRNTNLLCNETVGYRRAQ